MTQRSIRHLFKGNPMLAEYQREKKRALSEHNWKGGALAGRIMIGVFYFFFIVLTMSYIEVVEPFVVMYVMLGLVTIVIPANLHGAIAGEREARALDMLLVAPVTPGQIVVGKFTKALLSMALIVVFIGAPAFFIELVKQTDSQRYYVETNGVAGFFLSLLLVIATAFMLGGLSMWISSKTKTKTGALLGTVGAMFGYFLALPLLGSAMDYIAPALSEMIVFSNPYIALYYAYAGSPEYYGYDTGWVFSPAAYVWPTLFVQLFLGVCFLVMATSNLQHISLGRTE
jgi:ABC-type Na+ efflux pump permease subunit